jgi:hypothetical protein
LGAGRDPGPAERRRDFIAELDRMSPEERLRASRYRFEPWQRTIWAARYPEEAPLVNGEYEWVATRLVDPRLTGCTRASRRVKDSRHAQATTQLG